MRHTLNIGIDIGSTTIKMVITDNQYTLLHKDYRRHYAAIEQSLITLLENALKLIGDNEICFALTGSAGMGVAERCHLPFIQEVMASCEFINILYPNTKTLIDIGGEDAKMIFFKHKKSPDVRMNGNCAGGTGSFIDQVGTILNIGLVELSYLAEKSTIIYPIASRCGVFCKTDIQNLLSRNILKEDIAASVFHAVSLQVLTSLARGFDVKLPVMLSGGPFTFMPYLAKAFSSVLKVNLHDLIIPNDSEVIPAWGASIYASQQTTHYQISELIRHIHRDNSTKSNQPLSSLTPLFKKQNELSLWKKSKEDFKFPIIPITDLSNKPCFLGIDSGSTTTKIVACDASYRVFFTFYERNSGNSLDTLLKGLKQLRDKALKANIQLRILNSCVTGYGEDLIKAAFPVQHGMVETIAHYMSASYFNPDVSFILDIGGQDMKATYINEGIINRIDINEACSSGCGSFIETFAHSLNHTPASFSDIALFAKTPCDLGTRCTVFMNSKVKQSLRDGCSIADIAAGLGYSVIKNCLVKVLKIKDLSELGNHIMLQGGTFRNLAILKAFEIETGKKVMITDNPELMGAYGAAIYATKEFKNSGHEGVSIDEFTQMHRYTTKNSTCKGCENQCTITHFHFQHNKKYYSGNKCEKIFSNAGTKNVQGKNAYPEKYNLLFNRKNTTVNPHLTLGIPRALGIYENYPFWHTLFNGVNIKVMLSDASTMSIYEKGIQSVMSDNICFPAKITNGHIVNLIEKKVDRIFLPFVVYESSGTTGVANNYNCPIVTGYSEVIRSAINPKSKHQIPFDSPTISFRDEKLLFKACFTYLKSILPKLSQAEFVSPFKAALLAQSDYEKAISLQSKSIYSAANNQDKIIVLLSGRPYHTDPLIQHKISEIIASLGIDVITEDIVRDEMVDQDQMQSVMQWTYTNRIILSATWAAKSDANLHFIELTSFGCGPDAFILDEVADILHRKGKSITVLKIDDISNTGSVKLRIRSLIESLKYKNQSVEKVDIAMKNTPVFKKKDRTRKILMPWFADFYSPFLPAAFALLGYEAINLPPSNQDSAEYGLKYSNNEVCYPATLIVGDFMKALESGQYKSHEIALGISQTGGQCRATNYITLLKKALIAAGYDDIPVISISLGSGIINEQPGFKIKWTKIIKSVLSCIVYADCISQFYYATAAREKSKGIADSLKEKYIQLGIKNLEKNAPSGFRKLIQQAVVEFDKANNHKQIPRIGIVGEIFVKYNSFGHKNIIQWLISQSVEPIVPPLISFFTDTFPNHKARKEGFIHTAGLSDWIYKIAEKYVSHIIQKLSEEASAFPYYHGISNPYQDEINASQIINTNSQFGEGWRIPAEFSNFAQNGIKNVVSLQPFGCIANQIVSKGIEKRTRQLFPDLNLLYLDFDSGMGDANIFNRLHFMVHNAKSEMSE